MSAIIYFTKEELVKNKLKNGEKPKDGQNVIIENETTINDQGEKIKVDVKYVEELVIHDPYIPTRFVMSGIGARLLEQNISLGQMNRYGFHEVRSKNPELIKHACERNKKLIELDLEKAKAQLHLAYQIGLQVYRSYMGEENANRELPLVNKH